MILIGLGANLDGAYGPPESCIAAALNRFGEHGLYVCDVSRIWKTAPVPASDQPWYRNAVCRVKTDLKPLAVLNILVSLEDEAGRIRRERNAPRVLDLDLLAFHDTVMDTPALSVPHPRMHQRGFVLHPLCDIAPDWMHPVLKKSAAALLAMLGEEQAGIPLEGSRSSFVEKIHNNK